MKSEDDIQKLLDALCVSDIGGLDGSIFCSSVGLIKPREVSVVPPSAKTKDVIKLLQISNRGVVIIMTQTIEGIFSERDLVKKYFELDPELPIKNYMTFPVKTITPIDPLGLALTLMSKGGFRHLPVVDQGELLGVISVRDIIDFLSNKILSFFSQS